MFKSCSPAILVILLSNYAWSDEYYVDVPTDNLCEYGTGWANYCDPKLVIEKKPKKPQKTPQITIVQSAPTKPKEDANDPLVWLKNYQEGEQRARAKMLRDLNAESIEEYRRTYFNDTMDRGTIVSDLWRRSAWQNPDNDYTIKRPTGYLGKKEADLRRNDAVNDTLANLNERYGIFFVFESTCSACMKFAPILTEFAQTNNLYVRGISKDGKGIPTWNGPWSSDKNGAAYRLGLEKAPTPALALWDSIEKKSVIIGYGIMAHDDLANRIHVLTQVDVGEDY